MPSKSENTWQSFIPCLYSRSFVAFSDRIRAFIIAHKMATFLSNVFPSSQMNAQEEDAKSPPSRGGPEKEDKANTNNHYETLLVSTFASDEEIRRAYLKLALRCHPDKFGRRRRQQQEEEEEERRREQRTVSTNLRSVRSALKPRVTTTIRRRRPRGVFLSSISRFVFGERVRALFEKVSRARRVDAARLRFRVLKKIERLRGR